MNDDLDHNRRITSWVHAHPAKTATVADILALRANVIQNVEELGKKTREELVKMERIDDIARERWSGQAVQLGDVLARVGRLEQAAAELLVAVTDLEIRERGRTWGARRERGAMLVWRAMWRVRRWLAKPRGLLWK